MLLAHLRGLLKPIEPSTHAARLAEMQLFEALETQHMGDITLKDTGVYRNMAASTQDKSVFKQMTSAYNKAIIQGSNYKRLIRGKVVMKAKSLDVADLVKVYKILTRNGVR